MRVLYILQNTSVDGSLMSFMSMASEMRNRGVEIAVVAPDMLYEIPLFCKFLEGNVTLNYKLKLEWSCIYSNKNLLSKLRRAVVGLPLKIIRDTIRLNRIVKKCAPDIIHTNTGIIHIGWIVAKMNKLPHVWHLREYQDADFSLRTYPNQWLFRKMLRKSVVITVSDNVRHHFRLKPSEAIVIYNGVVSLNEIKPTPQKEKTFFVASRISKEKGHQEIVEAFNSFATNHKSYRLLIAGDTKHKFAQELETYTKTLANGNKIIFLGQLDRKGIEHNMRNATATVVASTREAFGRMTAEAAAYGCLIIGNKTGGTKEILNAVGGIPYDSAQPKALDDAMCQVADMPIDTYNTIVRNAAEKAKALFTTEAYGRNIWNVYSSILNIR